MIYIIYKILVLLKNHLNYLKDRSFRILFLRSIIDFRCFLIAFCIIFDDQNPRHEEDNIIKDIRNLFRLKK